MLVTILMIHLLDCNIPSRAGFCVFGPEALVFTYILLDVRAGGISGSWAENSEKRFSLPW